MKKLLPFAALTLVAAAFTSAALAATGPATATFQVLLTVTKACSVTAGAASNLNFGSQDPTTAGLAATNTFSVTCSKSTPYTVGLLPSNTNTSGAGVMKAQNVAPVTGNTDTVPYQLRSTAGATGTIWGNTATSAAKGNGVGATGTGAAVSHTVYATIAGAATNVTPDSYADTVTVQVNY